MPTNFELTMQYISKYLNELRKRSSYFAENAIIILA